MSVYSRIILAIVSLLLSLTYFFPLWQISLEAPQYPEGLGMEIWIDRIDGQGPGDLDKINNLNHYIGMKTIHPESIRELTIMPWLMRALMLLGLIAAATGRRGLLLSWIVFFALLTVAGMVDFYLWGYDYGHNLDMDKAIIKVPDMTYQPPLIGTKQLLNFTAHSWPGTAGWTAIGCFLAGLAIFTWEHRRSRKLPREASNAH